ncbi:hypothetical protein B5S32_g5770 [[Candida] boidinii]|nr:hypothetical protein B5S32_g5770 [[Candida] boidinii]
MDLIGDIIEHETDLNQPPDLSDLQKKIDISNNNNININDINDNNDFTKPTKWKLRLKNKKLNSMSNFINNDDDDNNENDENLSKINSMSIEEKIEFKDELLSLNPKILNILINRSEKKYGKKFNNNDITKDNKDTKNEIVDFNRELNKDELNSIFPVIEGPGTWIGGENKNSNISKSKNEIVNIYENENEISNLNSNSNPNEIVSTPLSSSSASSSSSSKSVPISPSLKPALRKKSTDPELDQLPTNNLLLEKKVRFNKEAKINYLESNQTNNNIINNINNNNNLNPQKLSRFKKNLKNNNNNNTGNNNINNSNNCTSGSNKSIKSKKSPSSSPVLTPKKIKNKINNNSNDDDDWEDITYISDNSQYVEPNYEESKNLSNKDINELLKLSNLNKNESKNYEKLDINDPRFNEKLKDLYFPDLKLNIKNLEWMKPINSNPDSINKDMIFNSLNDLRFDFNGNLITPELINKINTKEGLHHHSSNPEIPGYTLSELSRLSRSTFPSQRCIAIRTLGRILYKLGSSDYEIIVVDDDDDDETETEKENNNENNENNENSNFEKKLWEIINDLKIIDILTDASDEKLTKNLSVRNYAIDALWLWKQSNGEKFIEKK